MTCAREVNSLEKTWSCADCDSLPASPLEA